MKLKQGIGLVTLVVRDYDEAIAYFTQKLGFTLIEDSPVGAAKRWVVVAPPGAVGTGLLLAKATNEQQSEVIGAQAGGRVFLFLYTDDLQRDLAAYRERGVNFLEQPRHEPYGSVVVFEDLYGNRWDLIEPSRRQRRRTPTKRQIRRNEPPIQTTKDRRSGATIS
jgi:catechol 2,3-dioxygenase-like lactoylglutathione lyase family enzyme